jgi:trans-2-enoyl-CoA reductase
LDEIVADCDSNDEDLRNETQDNFTDICSDMASDSSDELSDYSMENEGMKPDWLPNLTCTTPGNPA